MKHGTKKVNTTSASVISLLLTHMHGLRTPRESFFQKFEAFGLGQTNWAEIFWGIWGIFGKTISTILALWVPGCPWENVSGSFLTKNFWFLDLKHITPKYDIGCKEFWKEPSHFRLQWRRAKSLNRFCNLSSILVEFFYDFGWLTWLRLVQSFKIIWAKRLLGCNVFQSFFCSRQQIEIFKKRIKNGASQQTFGPSYFVRAF